MSLSNCGAYWNVTSGSVSCSLLWAYGVVVSMFDFHCSDHGSNPGHGDKIS